MGKTCLAHTRRPGDDCPTLLSDRGAQEREFLAAPYQRQILAPPYQPQFVPPTRVDPASTQRALRMPAIAVELRALLARCVSLRYLGCGRVCVMTRALRDSQNLRVGDHALAGDRETRGYPYDVIVRIWDR